MFNLFKKKRAQNYNDLTATVAAIASFLIDDSGSNAPNPFREFLTPSELDYSLRSLLSVDSYLDEVRKHIEILTDDQYTKVLLRCGAYCGEVVRKQSKKNVCWIDYDTAISIDSRVKSIPKSPYTFYILFAEPNDFSFPMAKVGKYLDNGPEDSLHALATVLLSS